METNSKNCDCESNDKIVLACSGGSDLGEMSDIIARKLKAQGIYKMNCLAKIGFRDAKTIEEFSKANLLVIDGCPIDCGKKTLEQAGIANAKQLRLTDMGFTKGNCAATTENIDHIYSQALLT
jgi:uncharacterized metal-binding protein